MNEQPQSNMAVGNETFPYVMSADRPEPRSRQTRWMLRVLSDADRQEFLAVEGSTAARSVLEDELFAALSMVVASAAGPAYEAAKPLRSQLTLHEAWELYHAAKGRQRLTEGDEKN